MAIAHFAVGAGCTSLLLALLAPTAGYPRTVVALGGFWGLLPDVHWVVNPGARGLLHEVHSQFWMDVFWFHRTLDVLDSQNSRPMAGLAVIFFVAAVVAADYLAARSPDPDHGVE